TRHPAHRRLVEGVIVEQLWIEDIAGMDEDVGVGIADRLQPRRNDGIGLPWTATHRRWHGKDARPETLSCQENFPPVDEIEGWGQLGQNDVDESRRAHNGRADRLTLDRALGSWRRQCQLEQIGLADADRYLEPITDLATDLHNAGHGFLDQK